MLTSLGKGKGKGNVDLYSASSQTPLMRSDMDHTVLPANNTISACKRSKAAPPRIYAEQTPEFNLLLIYRPQEDEWLSWPKLLSMAINKTHWTMMSN